MYLSMYYFDVFRCHCIYNSNVVAVDNFLGLRFFWFRKFQDAQFLMISVKTVILTSLCDKFMYCNKARVFCEIIVRHFPLVHFPSVDN